MQLVETHIAEKLEKSVRFQEYGVGIFKTAPTKSALKKAIKKNHVFIDGILATTAKYISGEEKIELFQSENSSTFERLKLNLEVLYEDDYLAIIYKPAGILVSGNKFVTIANGLAQNLKKSNQADAVNPKPVHRLDYPTSGVLLIGKTSSSIQILSGVFKNKQIKKTYFAVTIGHMNTDGIIDSPIDNKTSATTYKVIETVTSKRFKFLNLLALKPRTGRRHQLRKHLSEIGHQILGDKEYGNPDLFLNGKGLYLHASSLEFMHPFTKETIFISKEIPEKFKKIFPNFKIQNIL